MSERRKEPPAQKTTGRPRRSKDEGLLSRSLTFRVRPPLYAKIQAAAELEQRSLSEEIEARLLRSFDQEKIEKHYYGDEGVAYLANIFAACVNIVQTKTGNKAWKDEETLSAIKQSCIDVLDSSVGLFDGDPHISILRKRFDREVLKHTWEELIKIAEETSSQARKPMSEIMGR